MSTTADDLFGGDYSQDRIVARATWPATMQWHGGQARGSREDFETLGGFFLPDDGIRGLGLDPEAAPVGVARETLKFGANRESGWGFALAHLAILQTAFGWEDRETRERFPRDEYRRRRQSGAGGEERLRGRLYALTVVRELADHGAAEPVLVTLRGTYSRALETLVRERLGALAATATKLRQRSGRQGAVPREAFWLPVLPAPLAYVGSGSQTSEVALPTTTLPETVPGDDRAFVDLARPLLVPREYTRAGGRFDEIWAQYRPLWEELAAFSGAPGDEGAA